MADTKYSLTGLLDQPHEVTRFENLFFKIVNSAYYNQDWGLDWPTFLSENYEISLDSFLSYLTQEATKRGIVIADLNGYIENFTLQLEVRVEGLLIQFKRDLS